MSPISHPVYGFVYYFHHPLEIYALLLRCSLYRLILIVTSVYQYTEGIGLLIDQWSALFKLFTNHGENGRSEKENRATHEP